MPSSSDGIPFLCGGSISNNPGDHHPYISSMCYRYVPEVDTWLGAGTLSGRQYDSAYDFTNSSGLVTAHFGQPIEFTKNGIDFQQGAGYPDPDVTWQDSGCLVVLDEENIFLAGGWTCTCSEYYDPNRTTPCESERAFMYNRGNDSWRQLPDMQTRRNRHSCGLVQSPTGTREIVVAGGQHEHPMEIFSVDSETWRWGKVKNYLEG